MPKHKILTKAFFRGMHNHNYGVDEGPYIDTEYPRVSFKITDVRVPGYGVYTKEVSIRLIISDAKTDTVYRDYTDIRVPVRKFHRGWWFFGDWKFDEIDYDALLRIVTNKCEYWNDFAMRQAMYAEDKVKRDALIKDAKHKFVNTYMSSIPEQCERYLKDKSLFDVSVSDDLTSATVDGLYTVNAHMFSIYLMGLKRYTDDAGHSLDTDLIAQYSRLVEESFATQTVKTKKKCHYTQPEIYIPTFQKWYANKLNHDAYHARPEVKEHIATCNSIIERVNQIATKMRDVDA